MPYVRINLVEYPSPEAMQENSDSLNADAGSIFPEIMLLAGIKLTDTSQTVSYTHLTLPTKRIV